MKQEIINKVFDEFENLILNDLYEIKIPIIQNNKDWNLEHQFHYSDENGINELLYNECTDLSKFEKIGNRYYIVLEYKRQNKGGNQPPREIYIGEYLNNNYSAITIKGFKLSFSEYCNKISKFKNKMESLKELDEFKKVFINNMSTYL